MSWNMDYWKKITVSFEMYEPIKEVCYMDKPDRIYGSQCCCNCGNHFELKKHCASFDREGKTECICNEGLGVYVCTCFGDRINISHKHGMCEMWRKKEAGNE